MAKVAGEIPPFFLCPISLQVMQDPVILSTGITYDRESIERWIFTDKHRTCPVSKQVLAESDLEPTPNCTLRRLIQSWCAANASDDIERFPTPRSPLDSAKISEMLVEARLPHREVSVLKKLRAVVAESDRNRLCVASFSGAIDFFISVVRKCSSSREASMRSEILDEYEDSATSTAGEEALGILNSLDISKDVLMQLAEKNPDLIDMLTPILNHFNYQSRAYAVMFLNSLVSAVDSARLSTVDPQLIREIVRVVQDQMSTKATKAALQVLGRLSPWGRNRVKSVEAGAVTAMIELLLDTPDKRTCELAIWVLDHMCGSAEGRAELLGHPAGLALLSKKILRVSPAATECAIRALLSVSKYSANRAIVQEMMDVGLVRKLCLVMQIESGNKAREKAKEMLKLHARVWKNPSCLDAQFLASYPC